MSFHQNLKFPILPLLCLSLLCSLGAKPPLDEVPANDFFKDMKWRSIGPANFSGRIVDVEALDKDFRHVVMASASGGVWKSTNAGTTWEPIFDHYGSASIGDIAIFQNDPDVIWVETGEANNRNSVG